MIFIWDLMTRLKYNTKRWTILSPQLVEVIEWYFFAFQSILTAIIIVSLKGLFLQFAQLKRLWKVSKIDYVRCHRSKFSFLKKTVSVCHFCTINWVDPPEIKCLNLWGFCLFLNLDPDQSLVFFVVANYRTCYSKLIVLFFSPLILIMWLLFFFCLFVDHSLF